VFLAALAAPIAWAATNPPSWIDEEYRRCVGDAVEEEMNARLEAQRTYSDEQVRDLETYRDALSRAWDIADEDERRDAIRDADRAYRDAGRESKRTYDAAVREARNDSRQAQRDCRDRQNDNENFVEDLCYSSADCRSNQYCTTETGTCDPACPPGVQSCAQVCAGTCERSSSSRSSRSSSRRSSSSRSSNGSRPWEGYQSNGQTCRSSGECQVGYFCSTVLGECNSPCSPGETCIQVCEGRCLLYPIDQQGGSSSSRASMGGQQGGANCQPYRCPDNREFPSCTADGHPIEYFQNPCYS
jgi:hypothetical protein